MVIILVLDFPMLMNCKSILPVTRARIAVSDRGTSPRGTMRMDSDRDLLYAVPRATPREKHRLCEMNIPRNKLNLFRCVLGKLKLRSPDREMRARGFEASVPRSLSCGSGSGQKKQKQRRLQTQISWNSIRKYGRVCTWLLCTINSNLFTYHTMRRTAGSFQFAHGQ